MAKGFAIHNSMTNHGGIIQATQQRTSQMGNLFLRAGDGHFCPKCKCWSEIVKSHDHIIMDGKAVAYVDDLLTCGAKILPKQDHVVGTSQGSLYIRSSGSKEPLQNSFVDKVISTNFGLQYQLLDETTNEPITELPYRIIRASGEVIEGITDAEGKTQAIASGNEEEQVQFIIPVLSEPMESWE
ncbi:PAAR domain-containing protein [Acinetobacter guillouiae]|uniref:PAAR domain-containing protein n=1 Tax=Acinetobacter guillouiae TaxID=106649 RepID=A0A8X8GK62_ACIGI|nr:PAAR domain-containing protein [Acinetobacter guillouiae]MCF0265890.1 PAAR domain-containing protein [Acinetobacter guillouiae]